MLLSLLLLTVLAAVFQPASTREPVQAYRHSIFIFKANNAEGIAHLDDQNQFKLYRRQLTTAESQYIARESRTRVKVAEHKNETLSFEDVKWFYIRIVEKALNINVGLSTKAATRCQTSFWTSSCQTTAELGADFDPWYKQKFADWFAHKNYKTGKDYRGQMPMVDKSGKTRGPSTTVKPIWQCSSSGHNSNINISRTATTINQKDAELSKKTEISAEIKASLEVSYEFLSLSVEASHGQTVGSSSSKLSSEMKSTSFKVSYEEMPNKVYFIRDQTIPIAMGRSIYVPFEATGWLVDMAGKVYSCGNFNCWSYSSYDHVTDAIMFPVGDMAYYFPTLMKRSSANAMVFNGPAFDVLGEKNEHFFHIKEFDAAQKNCNGK